MIVFNDNHSNKIKCHTKRNTIIKRSVKQTRRTKSKRVKVTKSNKEFLRALGFKT